jgi:MFS family permease
MKKDNFYGWKLLSALWIIVFINLAFPIYGQSILNAVMLSDLNLDRRTLGYISSLYTLMSGLPGPLVALSIQRFGVRLTLFLGSLLTALGSVIMATAVSTGLHAALAFGIVVGVGVAMGGIIGGQTGTARWFIRRRALALAIISSATAVGGFVAAPLLNKVIAASNGNWRMGWWLMASLSCVAAIIALVFVKEKPEDLGQLPDGGESNYQKREKSDTRPWRGAVHLTNETWTSREALTGSFFWILMLCQMGVGCGYTVFLAHGVVHLKDLGHSSDTAALAISLMAISGLISKALVGTLGDRIDPRYLWAVFIGVFGVGQLFVPHADTMLLVVVIAVCIGIGFGGGVVCLAAVLSNYYGIKVFAALVGLSIAVGTIFSSIIPPIAGWLYDNGHGYQGVFYALAIWCFAGMVTLLVIKPPFRKMSREP